MQGNTLILWLQVQVHRITLTYMLDRKSTLWLARLELRHDPLNNRHMNLRMKRTKETNLVQTLSRRFTGVKSVENEETFSVDSRL